ncbi:type IX secretion system anionic LPS delivery protein PorZ [Chryseolinea lacunae]|uniref:T9SS type A sorting domain-containing protein n=1 Tax=Chryseolinea lacunae TaxID=2801331 RepID=A0ABS1KPY7_9BACT|nr:T9SS type A sorting domain-containing protein [Chryseolinea lacunae]MBL0741535.1 T9SS type A sorting domain-containing protein [Chryseolinea lacunae]
MLKRAATLAMLCCVLLSQHTASAQADIPMGTWRMHVSYSALSNIAIGNQKVYGAARNGIMVLDRADNSMTTFTKLDGLNGTGIAAMNYDATTQTLLIAYEDGKLDVVDADNSIAGFDPTKNSTLTGSRKINHIALKANLAYLATDYGVVLFDLARKQVKETWRDLGASGQTLRILQSTFTSDSIFLATEKGVVAGNLNDNLLDFANWKRFSSGELNAPIQSVAVFNNKLYAAINTAGLYTYQNGTWAKESYLQGATFSSLNVSDDRMTIVTNTQVWTLSVSEALAQISDPLITLPRMALASNGALWIADGQNGLVSNATGSYVRYVPNSPSNTTVTRLTAQGKRLFAVGGGYSSTFTALGKPGLLDVFENGSWTTQTSSLTDLTDFSLQQTHDYAASFGFGLQQRDATGTVKIFDATNSTLVSTGAPARVNVTALAPSTDGLWVSNYGVSNSLHLLKPDNTWQAFSFPATASRYPLKLAVDLYGGVWMVLNPAQGGGLQVFNKSETVYLTDVVNGGGLPSRSVRSIAVDRDGLVWVGTDLGVAYFLDPFNVYKPGSNAVKPIFDDRFLLKDDKVTAIAIDGGNRKWMGTERGVWLFGPDGQRVIHNFTTANSPLLSNIIRDIAIDAQSGEVFFATAEGLVSFRADATESTATFQSVKIFPNPVHGTFSGTVGISGLATDAIVKITDVAGKLVWQSQANGGTASWNMLDYTGRRPATGVYLVFSATPDGVESFVGKIALID